MNVILKVLMYLFCFWFMSIFIGPWGIGFMLLWLLIAQIHQTLKLGYEERELRRQFKAQEQFRNGQQVWFPNPDKPGSNMYVAEGREGWERISRKA